MVGRPVLVRLVGVRIPVPEQASASFERLIIITDFKKGIGVKSGVFYRRYYETKILLFA